MLLPPVKLEDLKQFLKLVKSDYAILDSPELNFFKEWLIELGATIPKVVPKKEEPKVEENLEDEDEDPGRIPPDNDPPQEMGNSSVEVSEEDQSKAQELKAIGLQQQGEGKFDEAISSFTEAIKLNPKLGILFATRAQCYLLKKKPNMAIRDCDRSIFLNPDSAKAYKIRGKSLRALGKFEQALKDIQLGNKLDFDEGSAEIQKFLEEKVAEIKKKKAPAHSSHCNEHDGHDHGHGHDQDSFYSQGSFPGAGAGFPGAGTGFPGAGAGFPGAGFPGAGAGIDPSAFMHMMNDPEVMQLLSDPAILGQLQQAMSNPAKMAELASDPRFAKLAAKFGSR